MWKLYFIIIQYKTATHNNNYWKSLLNLSDAWETALTLQFSEHRSYFRKRLPVDAVDTISYNKISYSNNKVENTDNFTKRKKKKEKKKKERKKQKQKTTPKNNDH